MGDGCRFQPLIFGSMLTQRFLLAYFLAQTDVTDDQDTHGTCNDINGETSQVRLGGFLTGSSEGSLLKLCLNWIPGSVSKQRWQQ